MSIHRFVATIPYHQQDDDTYCGAAAAHLISYLYRGAARTQYDLTAPR